MNRPDPNRPDTWVEVRPDLDQLLRRLHEGMQLKGRILRNLGDGRYLLRIWGYNIISESDGWFGENDEVCLTVRRVYPHLLLNFQSRKRKRLRRSGRRLEMTV